MFNKKGEKMGGKERTKREGENCPERLVNFFFLPIIVVETESHIPLAGFEFLFKDSDVQTKI